MCCLFIFFFKQKTAYEMRISDWSSDVCSSDLQRVQAYRRHQHVGRQGLRRAGEGFAHSGRSSDNFWKLSQFGSMRKFMSSLAQQITAAGLADHILSERQLGRLLGGGDARRSEEHTSELQSLMRISYAVFCLKKKTK